MCGIVGFAYSEHSRPCDPCTVVTMRDVFPYRGPDDAGVYTDGPAGLGQRRLSIIDLSGGHQPMCDWDGRFWIVFNGEIYNYRTLRQELVSKGCRFQTDSDTEVILQLYATLGEGCVREMNGMFAFAIWDRREGTLFLARDRMGVKPLYYAQTAEAFIFASEIKAIFASGLVQPRRRNEAMAEYLMFRQVSGGDTIYEGVTSLPPGCTMTVSGGRSRLCRYWSPYPSPDRRAIPYGEARERLADLLEDSVKLRMISDVPLGTFCSGGVDSSLITAIAARIKGEPVNTFSVGFDETDFDESEFAAIVSKQYGTVHHTLRVGNARFSELLPRMVWHNDEPLNFANSVQIFAISELARQHVTVVLTGEGSDELFAGYPRYRLPGLAAAYRHVPATARRLIGRLVSDHRLEKLSRHAGTSCEDMLMFNTASTQADVLARLCPGLPPAGLDHRRQCLARSAALGLNSVARLSLLDQETYLVSILHRQDKMSMAASIESRVPFLDYRIVEFANQLPTAYKIRRGSGKAIVKDIARQLLPVTIVTRRKSGFGVPLGRWFRTSEGLGERLRALAEDAPRDLFDRAVLRQLIEEHRFEKADHSELLWTVMNVCLWQDAFKC